MRSAALPALLFLAACAAQPDPFHVERAGEGRYRLTAPPVLADGRSSEAFVNARGHRLCKSGHSVMAREAGVGPDGRAEHRWLVACNTGARR